MKTIVRFLFVAMCVALVTPALATEGALPGFGTEPGKIVHFKLSGPLPERPADEMASFLSPDRPVSLHELVRRMKKARDDQSVKAIVLSFESPQLGLAQLEELRHAIDQIKAVDKEVYFQADDYMRTGLYCLACSASHVSVVPTCDLWITGLYGESPYLRGLLDKIGVVPEFLHIAEYKTAAEILTRTGPSEAAQAQTERLVDHLYARIVSMIAESRGLPDDTVEGLIDRGLFTAEEAKKAKLIDSIMHHRDFVDHLHKRYGEDVRIVRRYGEDSGPDFDFSNPFAIFEVLREMFEPEKMSAKDAIGIVYVEGPILTGSEEPSFFGRSGYAYSTTIRKALEKAARDEKIKAVVLRVDSPGGSALASEIIWDAGERVKAKKPFIVSMGNVAASGGYYVACGADTIFADATTLTGSIGVVGGKLVTTGMWDKLGVSWHETKRGANADLLNTSHPFSDRERKLFFDWMHQIYEIFTGHVTDGRGDKLKKPIEEIAGGRVYTGEEAWGIGLVDKLGTMDDAIKFAAEQANISDYEIRSLPEPKTLIDAIMETFGGEEDDEAALDVGRRQRPSVLAGESPLVKMVLPLLVDLDPSRARALSAALTRLQLIHDEGIVLMMPFELVIR